MKAENAYHYCKSIKDDYWDFYERVIKFEIKKLREISKTINIPDAVLNFHEKQSIYFVKSFLKYPINKKVVCNLNAYITPRDFDLDYFYKDMYDHAIFNISASNIPKDGEHIIFLSERPAEKSHIRQYQTMTETQLFSAACNFYEKFWYCIPLSFIKNK